MRTLQAPGLQEIRPLLQKALREDGAWADRTTRGVVPAGARARVELLCKSNGVLAGLPFFIETLRLMEPRAKFRPLARDGQRLKAGQRALWIEGKARGLLSAERTALNLLSRLSGIATLTRRFREKLGIARLYDTRKTTPLWRELERYAVRVGGGLNHRFNLASQVLIKDNHLKLGGGVYASVRAARKRYGPGEFIEVEVEDFVEASEALRAGADMILVDNADPRLLKKVLALVKGKMGVEVSGGLTLSNIHRYAALKADRFSSGSLTHSAPSLDFSLEFHPL
ncbi:MAG TPA: carboxylating nicotinate-nucleotide diphosphorylase [bacterium]|nr:carboxylating nicotinate-nucleotide diphosphorylase [bacterium]